ncbi:MAG: penicillin-binding protein 1A, partial [Caulobacter sp.]|nr:penicillin-binding protein 1A [Caulobacter sp.]
MLQGVVQRGTAAQASSLGYPLAGKTGTTNEYRSAWFVGYSPSLVVGVFIGFDDNRSLGEGETGAAGPVPIFIDFMREVLKGQPKTEFKAPPNAKYAMVRGIREAFRPGTEPKVVDPTIPTGPQGYDEAWPGGQIGAPPANAEKPPTKVPDISGLY